MRKAIAEWLLKTGFRLLGRGRSTSALKLTKHYEDCALRAVELRWEKPDGVFAEWRDWPPNPNVLLDQKELVAKLAAGYSDAWGEP